MSSETDDPVEIRDIRFNYLPRLLFVAIIHAVVFAFIFGFGVSLERADTKLVVAPHHDNEVPRNEDPIKPVARATRPIPGGFNPAENTAPIPKPHPIAD